MLRGIHKASANWLGRIVMGVVLGLIAISFGIWGIGDIFRGFGQSTVAKVGGTEIRVEQFRQLYQDRLQQLSRQVGRPVTPDQARMFGIDRQLLAQVVAETVLDERAKALGLGISEAEVARRVMEDPNFRGLAGQFDRGRFDYIIRQIGYSEARYLAEQRKSLVRQQLVGTVSGDFAAPKTALDALNRYQNEQRTIEFVVLDKSQAGEIEPPSPEVLTKYFEDRKILFRTPEYRKILVYALTPAELASSLEISDDDVKKAFEQRKARFTTPEQRHVFQLPFATMDEAQAAAERIGKGETLAAIAAERGLKDADFDLGTIAKTGMLDPAIAEAAFALKEGEVSAPVQGRFGPVLVQAARIVPLVTRPLEEVAADLRRDLANERSRSELTGVHDKIEDERLGGVNLTDIAKKLNLRLRTIDAIDRSGQGPDGKPVPDLPQGVDLLNAVFQAELGIDNDPLSLPQSGGYVWFEVTDIKPARDRTLEEVKDQLEVRWRDDQIAAALRKKADEIVARLQEGKPFNEVVAELNLKPEWRPGIKRGTPPPGIPARALDTIFRTAKDSAAATDGMTPTERIVFRVTAIDVAPLDPESADAKRMDQALRRSLSDDVLAQFVARLENIVGVTINQTALNQVTGASPAN